MKQKYVIGVDVSKLKIDCAAMSIDLQLIKEKVVMNTDQKIHSFLTDIIRKLKIEFSDVLVCCENTGIYNRPLERVCTALGINLWVEHALKIKRASTDMRGKDDRKDAIRIAEYAIRYQDKLVIYKESSELLRKLDALIKARESLVSQRVAIENQLREAKSHDPFEYEILSTSYKVTLRAIAKSLSKIEEDIDQVTKENEEISHNIKLLTSIPGIGKQCAVNLILATNNFKSFSSAKHLACYSGVVPFNNQSGVIIKRPRVSKMANKNLKRLMHMAAMSTIRSDSELKAYYIRKVKEGKNKMSVINAIRNKLIHRVMSVINRKTPFLPVDDYFYQRRNNFSCILT